MAPPALSWSCWLTSPRRVMPGARHWQWLSQANLRSCSSFQLSGLSPAWLTSSAGLQLVYLPRRRAPLHCGPVWVALLSMGEPVSDVGTSRNRIGSPAQVGSGRGRRMCLAGLFVPKPSSRVAVLGNRVSSLGLTVPPTSAGVRGCARRSLLSPASRSNAGLPVNGALREPIRPVGRALGRH
jgi:hypothetical protein